MKRKLVNDSEEINSLETKKSKTIFYENQNSQLISDDVIFEILKFIEFDHVIKTCFLISKQWYCVASMRHLFTDIVFDSEEAWNEFGNVSYIENIVGMKFGICVQYKDVEKIGKFKQMTDLKMSGVIMEEEYTQEIKEYTVLSDILDSFPKLTKLDISMNNTFGENVIRSIASFHSLEYLDISNVYVDINLFETLSESERLCQSLTFLNVAENYFSLNDDLNGLSKLTQLRNLIIDSNGLSDSAYHQISLLKNLTSLSVANCFGGRGGGLLHPVMNCLSQLVNLKNLDISHNSLQSGGVSLLTDSIKNLSFITTLNLGGNRITDEGVLVIVNSMQKLNYINLDYNKLTDGSISKLTNMKSFVKKISVCLNEFTENGKQELMELGILV